MTPTSLASSRLRTVAATALLAVAAACGEPDAPDVAEAPTPEDTAQAGTSSGWVYERTFVFTTLDRDSAYVAPWLFRTRTRPGGVDRTTRGWITRGGEWEEVLDQSWETPPSRAPWRLLPRGPLTIVVGPGDAVEELVFEEGPRALELLMGDVLMEWTATDGEVLRLLDGSLVLADQEVPGMVLDRSRTLRADGPPAGDWAFLVSGDSLQMVLERPRAGEPGAEGALRAWARLDFRDLRWAEVTLGWAEERAFPAARRDIPVAWEVSQAEGRLRGSLQATNRWAQALEGPGPLLPLEALFSVTGTVSVEGRTYPVRGLLRHTRS